MAENEGGGQRGTYSAKQIQNTKVLTSGCVMLGAGAVTGVDIDPDALDTFQQNIVDFDMENVDLVNIDVNEVDKVLKQKFEVVIMNPPFGTKHNKGTTKLYN